jgi:DNA-binding NarL/FixJ family response regulator
MQGLPLSTSTLRVVADGSDWVEALAGRYERLRVFVAGASLDAAVRVAQADVVLIDAGRDVSRLVERIGSLTASTPVLAVAPAEALLSVVAAGASGVLSLGASEDEVVAALWALREGLAVFDRSFVQSVLPSAQPQVVPAAVEESGPARAPFTTRERQVLTLLVEGLSNREIGTRLEISEHTAKFHVNSILQKMGAQKRVEAVVRAARLGLINI